MGPNFGPPTIGLVTALPEEFTAMRALVDGGVRLTVDHDRAAYLLGTVPSPRPDRPHPIVLTLLGETGNNAAAESCVNLIRSFPSVNCVVMVGIAAGVPRPRQPDRHVRLGDIAVATWGIVDYDHVTETSVGPVPRQPFPRPSPLLVRGAKMLEADEKIGERPWEDWLEPVPTALSGFTRPPAESDVLYASDGAKRRRPHPDDVRSGRRTGRPKVHYGRIGSADRALRSARVRDELVARYDMVAIEMEGKGIGNAGFANGLEWFVVRGVSDYGDRRTSMLWRNYAALVAAAYTRALLATCAPLAPRGGHSAGWPVLPARPDVADSRRITSTPDRG
jgi:nucleoside phosphorylase